MPFDGQLGNFVPKYEEKIVFPTVTPK